MAREEGPAPLVGIGEVEMPVKRGLPLCWDFEPVRVRPSSRWNPLPSGFGPLPNKKPAVRRVRSRARGATKCQAPLWILRG